MADGSALDPLYVAARRVLLDALTLLAPYGKAVIVVGAQAVYLRTGKGDVGITIAPYTTDGDLVLNPTLLASEPDLEALMIGAGFSAEHPGMWQTTVLVNGEDVIIPIDLLVPEGASTGEGRRGARIPPHGKRAARRAVGLEAALVDHSPMTAEVTVQALDIMRNVFVRRAGDGVAMAQRALQLAVDPAQVATLCVAFTEQLLTPHT